MVDQRFDPSHFSETSWLSLVAESSQLYVGYMGLDGRYRYVNSKYAAWFKIPAEKIVGKTLEEIATSKQAYEMVKPYVDRALNGEHIRFEFKHPEAGKVSFVCEFFPHKDPKTGKLIGVVCVSQDVTEAQRSIAAVALSEQRFRSLTNTIPQLMWTSTSDGQVDFVNDRCMAYSGLTSTEKFGEKWAEFIHPDDRAGVFAEWAESVKAGRAFKMEYRLRDALGIYRWFLGHAVPIQENNEIQYWIGTATDIEEERLRAAELTQAKLAAEDASRAKSAFLANMSHEIRTPLGAILGFSALLKNEVSQQERTQFAETIERNGKMLTRIIDDLLDLARIEAGHMVIDRTNLCVRALLEDVMALFKDKAALKNVKLSIGFDEGTPEEIESDPVRLRQILINLIGNAVKFTDQGSISVTVESEPQTDGRIKMSFVVKDSGTGIDLKQLSQLFRPFTQIDPSSTRRHGGTGLGLALSRRLAEALGGEVELRASALNQGCTFVASILTTAVAKEEAKAVPNLTFAEPPTPADLDGIKILVVDDSPDNLELVKRILTSKHAEVETSESGAEAAQFVSKKSYDVVMLDIQMPSMDGYQTIEAFRKMGFEKPVIAFTAHAMIEERIRTKAASFAHHLTKPLNIRELVDVVAKFGRKPAAITG